LRVRFERRRDFDHRRINRNKAPVAAEVSDESLLCQICVGNGEALAVLFERYARLTRSVAARILRDTAEAEDLVQDLFLYIQRKCEIFDSSKSSARSWIVQMAYHRALDRRRCLKSREFDAQPFFQANGAQVVGIGEVGVEIVREIEQGGAAEHLDRELRDAIESQFPCRKDLPHLFRPAS
jgi:RNA polymerase sigma factor (sigma-70 family)